MQNIWIIPLLIYLGKILELALNSIRIVAIAKGFKGLAIIISFIESIIWIVIITGIIEDINNTLNILAFGLGMATGVYVGIRIEEKLALGLVLVRVITQKTADELLSKLRNAGFRVTDVDATSNYGNVKILFSTIKRKNLKDFTQLVKQFNPYAFFTVEEVRMASQAIKKSSRKNIDQLLTQFHPNNQNSQVNMEPLESPLKTSKKPSVKKKSSLKLKTSSKKAPTKKKTTSTPKASQRSRRTPKK